ncbi:hypothetical protein KY285_007675 [Solanum tuberosum]|nr:hypothetical protein KY289_008009 [Solanum tuberosum]KAH0746018.1 hypothetical protein KY285_007675 [Solanum tuberosum]
MRKRLGFQINHFKLVICVTTTIGVRPSFLTRQAFFDYWCEASGLYEPPNSLACMSRVDACSGRLIWGWLSSIRLSVPTYPKFYPVLKHYFERFSSLPDEFAEFSQYREFLKEFISVTTLVDVKLWNLGPSKPPPLPYHLY